MKTIRKLLSAILACTMLLALAACGGSQGSASGSGAAAEGDTFKIGVIYPMSGGNAFFGNAMVDATKIAIDWVNENGGINGKQIVAIYGDGATSNEASTEATRLIDSEGVNVILGSMSSGNANAIRSAPTPYSLKPAPWRTPCWTATPA